MKPMIQKIHEFYRKETVLFIAGAAAILTMLFVPPSKAYLSYIDFRVLALLFCLMAVVAGFNKTGVFLVLSERLLHRVKNTRSLCFVLIMLCFFTSMWITNDVALITFVPFAILILSAAGQTGQLIFVVVMQTIAANLGSMLTPVGNPQNLYLYSLYHVPIREFLLITLPITVTAFLMIGLTVFFVKKEPIPLRLNDQHLKDNASHKVFLYFILFLVCLTCVLRLLDYRIVLLIVTLCILIFDRSILKNVDYFLLLTFICFFIFVGNIGIITSGMDYDAVLDGRELQVSILLSQVISNVPAAVLLSAFSGEYKDLILGTDLGGLGTLVASLASLISYKFYCRTEGANNGKYLKVFTAYNLFFLLSLYIIYLMGKKFIF